jgi:hypothetical protein
MQEVDCQEMCDRVVENLDSAIRESGATVICDQLPRIYGSPQLEQVFQNLVSNAIKYRKPDVAPRILVSATREEGAWLFSVTDNGIGIAPEYRERIFEMFRRLHGQEIPGSGMGLALVRKIAETHGGNVWVESAEGEGSVFRMRLPQAVSKDESATSSGV